MGKKVLIVGGVAGGASTAARLRRLDEGAEIIIFEKGKYISYANCGLPYYIGNVIKERDALLLQTPEIMKQKFNVDVRTENEVIAINREEKEIVVKNLKTGNIYREKYDVLVLSTGSFPVRPPIEGINAPNIFTLWTVPDTDMIKNYIKEQNLKRAAVIGGGFIGIEMAENLHQLGMEVSIIEMQDQIMPAMDYEMAQILHENIRSNNVNLILKDSVTRFVYKDSITSIYLQSGKIVDADLIIVSTGVRPNSELAKDAGLSVNERGGIVVDKYLRTSDENIYAIGDVIKVEDFVSKEDTMIPLAGPANKQGRICANNICGANEAYNGTQGTAIAKVFDMAAASTGLNEKSLKKKDLVYKKDYFSALIYQRSHAGYYPGAAPLALKLLFDPDGKIFGAQAVGQDGVDKRIDTLAATIRLGGTIYDLKELELAYAPPFSSAKDPVNMLGFVAENILTGKVDFLRWDEIETLDLETTTILDVTEAMERTVGHIPYSEHIPLGQLREKLDKLNKDKLIVTYCAIGVRAYIAARILMENGFKKVMVFEGGFGFYKALFHDKNIEEKPAIKTPLVAAASVKSNHIDTNNIKTALDIDCSGLQCPGPIMKVFKAMNEINEGDIIKVSATDAGFAKDIDSWCRKTGNTLLKAEKNEKDSIVYIQKGTHTPAACPIEGHEALAYDGKSIIVFSNDLDKVLASFIIANGAASMGRKVTMFFTFWGLNVLRKNKTPKIKKPLMDKMFGFMMPKGINKLTLSKMSMGGIGTAMMKKVMKDKNVDSLQDLVQQAMDNGVRIVACTMSMDVMGLTKEELIDGIDYAGVASYLASAEESNVNLFI